VLSVGFSPHLLGLISPPILFQTGLGACIRSFHFQMASADRPQTTEHRCDAAKASRVGDMIVTYQGMKKQLHGFLTTVYKLQVCSGGTRSRIEEADPPPSNRNSLPWNGDAPHEIIHYRNGRFDSKE
jgi:hypothetical protein